MDSIKATKRRNNCARNGEMFAKVRATRSESRYYPQINSLYFYRAREDSCWDHDKSIPYRPETNGIPKHAVRRVKEGTCALLARSGLSEMWWAEVMECFCCLRNIQDKLAHRKSPFFQKKIFGTPCDGSVIPHVELKCISIQSLRKTKSRLHQFGTKCFEEYSSDTRRLDWRLDHRGLARH